MGVLNVKSEMEQWRDMYLEYDATYENHVRKFVSYLVEHDLANRPTEIRREQLENCVEFWVKAGNIKSYNSLSNHLESIKAFYNYLILQGKATKNLVPSAGYAEFKKNLANRLKLKDGIEREWLDNDEIKNILDKLDEYFEITNYSILGKHESGRYVYRMALRIYLKICLIAPAKKNILYNLKIKDFKNGFRIVIVNGIDILIPNGLRYNIIHTLKFIENIFHLIPQQTDCLFPFINECAGTKDNQGKGTKLNNCFANFLKEYNFLDVAPECDSYPVEIISNTTIYNLIIQGTNPYYISQITGTAISRLESKYYKKLDTLRELRSNKSAQMELNNSISNCEYYQYI